METYTLGMVVERHPFGSTTADEHFWSDEFVEECMVANNLSEDDFEELTQQQRESLLRSHSRMLELEGASC